MRKPGACFGDLASEPGENRMDKASANPLLVGLLFILRCLVPLLIMLGISYLLKRLGLIQTPTEPPAGWEDENNETENGDQANPGSLSHGKA